MTFPEILSGLRRPAADASAADLRASLAQAEAQHTTSTAEALALAATHGEMLLAGDPAALATHEAAMQKARTEAERAGAIIPALRARIEAAEAREADAALQAEAEAMEVVAAAAAEDIRLYERTARDLLALAERINAATDRVTALNTRLRERQRNDLHVPVPMGRVWPHHAAAKLQGMAIPGPRRTSATLARFEEDIAGPPVPFSVAHR